MLLEKDEKNQIIKDFAQGPQDTGSVEVQIALLTKTIRQLTEHCQKNAKDFSSKRGLLKMVCRRRGFLRYLERNNVAKYKELIDRLGLRK
jgi:small subunit ribosomal protein S15